MHVSVLVVYTQVWGLSVCSYWECYMGCIGSGVCVLLVLRTVGIGNIVGIGSVC